jgi:hypothetical protein
MLTFTMPDHRRPVVKHFGAVDTALGFGAVGEHENSAASVDTFLRTEFGPLHFDTFDSGRDGDPVQ